MNDDIYYADNQAIAALLLTHRLSDYEGTEVITIGGYQTFCYKFRNGIQNRKFIETLLGTSIDSFKWAMREFVKESKLAIHR